MIIEDQESFKTWLTKVLEPLCDADPAALAKYVFALVKKDKPIPELRTSMVEQLDVFLQQETKSFVDLLFTTLENKNYHIIQGDPEFTKSVDESEEINSSSPKHTSNQDLTQHVDKQLSTTIPNGGSSNTINEPLINSSVAKSPRNYEHVSTSSGSVLYHGTSPSPEGANAGEGNSARSNTLPPIEPGSGRESPAFFLRSSRSGVRSRSKSRSRSWERGERVLRRDRRDRSTRAWRNKSPPSRRHERRRSWSRNRASRSRSRSPRYTTHRGRYRNRSPPQNRPIQTSNAMRTTSRVQSTGTPTQDSNHGDVDMRLNTTSQSIHSLIGKENVASSDLTTATASTNAINFPKRRCNDFDEKGYCMRGDLCPYDHGNDPVVLEDIALSRVLTFGPGAAAPAAAPTGVASGNASGNTAVTGASVAASGPVVSPRVPPQTTVGSSSTSLVGIEASVQPPVPSGTSLHHIQGTVHNPQHSVNVRPIISTMEYNPDEPSIAPRLSWNRNNFRTTTITSAHRDLRNPRAIASGIQGNNGIPAYTPQRELINVPMSIEHSFTHNPTFKRRRPEEGLIDLTAKKKTAFDFNRLGPRSKNSHNSSLELKKIPRGLNSIEHLNNHFSKFGKIVNIQVSYEGDPEAAIVTFSSHAEANAAYRSTEAVLNNRFIKVFWHNSNEAKDTPIINNMSSTTQATNTSINTINTNLTSNTSNNSTPAPARVSVKERLGFPAKSPLANPHRLVNHPTPLNEEKTQPSNISKTVYIPTAMRKPEASSTPTSPVAVHAHTPESIPQTQQETDSNKKASELIAAKKLLKIKHEEKRQEALKLTVNLRKRKQELLDKQLQQQRELLSRLEKTTNLEQKEDILRTLKSLQDNIQHIKKDLTDVVNTMSTQVKQNKPTVKRSREEAQKELLDAELDLINKQQEGEDTTEIQRRIAHLKTETRGASLANSGPLKSANSFNRYSSGRHVTNRTLNRNSSNTTTSLYRTNGDSHSSRITPPGNSMNTFSHSSIDHRPTHILISGYETDDKDQVVEHFAQFGQVTEISVDEFIPSVVLGYSTRKEAEVAVTKGRNFQDRLLSVTWSHGNNSAANSAGSNNSSNIVSTVNSSSSLISPISRIVQTRFNKGGQNVSQNNKNDDNKIEDLLSSCDDKDVQKLIQNIEEPKHVLLGDEDEEDEDGEVRSWRR